MVAASFRPFAALGCALLLPLVAGCAAPAAPRPEVFALEAPVPSPPGDLPVGERIRWWEDRLPLMASPDRDEAYMRLGQLHLDSGQAVEARLSFRQAQLGWLSEREQAQAEYGIALSYLLEDRIDAATPHLLVAEAGLAGPEAEECAFLLEVSRGGARGGDPAMLARLGPYLPEDALAAATPATGPGLLSGVIDVSRSQWHASRIRPDHEAMSKPWRLTVHHSAEPFHAASAASSKAEVRRIQQFHQDGRGWADLGYHFLVDREGRVFEGRSMEFQGAHAFGDNNVGNIGVCLLGNFAADPERGGEYARVQSIPAAQLAGLRELVDLLRSRYGIDRSEVHGHSELRGTACPGPALLSWVERYRAGR